MKLPALYETLRREFGPQYWWPIYSCGKGKCIYKHHKRLSENEIFEISAGAILTQNTSWTNVEKALHNLKEEKILSVKGVVEVHPKRLSNLVRPARYGFHKSRYLKAFANHVLGNYKGSSKKMFSKKYPQLREELLALTGIGNETADSMLLYAGNKPVFVVDAYTKRILGRVYRRRFDDYDALQNFCVSQLPKSKKLYNEFHALLVAQGNKVCRPKPKCGECALAGNCKSAE